MQRLGILVLCAALSGALGFCSEWTRHYSAAAALPVPQTLTGEVIDTISASFPEAGFYPGRSYRGLLVQRSGWPGQLSGDTSTVILLYPMTTGLVNLADDLQACRGKLINQPAHLYLPPTKRRLAIWIAENGTFPQVLPPRLPSSPYAQPNAGQRWT